MPRGDGTGPWGEGPMTGRGLGFCTGFDRPGIAYPRYGRGFGWSRGFGRGRGFGWRFQAAPVSASLAYTVPRITREEEVQVLEQDIQMLDQEKRFLEEQIVQARKRLESLKMEK